jgi:hypothetical protein
MMLELEFSTVVRTSNLPEKKQKERKKTVLIETATLEK